MVLSSCNITSGDCHGTYALHAPSTTVEHEQSTDAVRSRARNTTDPQRPTHQIKALLKLRMAHPAMLPDSQIRPHNAPEKVARECACDRWRTEGEVST